ncbi:unnamed protein product [Heligmosomoides polygyrus]|uniref:PAS domain-containing protein n=1 Tax=Heligmosomoides polygyrus TaxID=6339 RepID=A0A183FE31_HELPZ|nr:unnamed protein product [Heligmosomoides polygyrus]
MKGLRDECLATRKEILFRILRAVQWSSRDTSLVEFVARLANRIRVMPALFAVLDEVGALPRGAFKADQAVEVCDESKVVQYVNRAYESVTGCLRGEVVGRGESVFPRPSSVLADRGGGLRRLRGTSLFAVVRSQSAELARQRFFAELPPSVHSPVAGQPESDMRRKSLPRPRDDSQMERRRSSDWKCIRVPTSSHNFAGAHISRGRPIELGPGLPQLSFKVDRNQESRRMSRSPEVTRRAPVVVRDVARERAL